MIDTRCSLVLVLALVVSCGVEGEGINEDGLDDVVVVNTYPLKVYQLANQAILTTRPIATQMMTDKLNLVLAQNSILDLVSVDAVEQRIHSPLTNGTPDTTCPYIKEPTGNATLSCHYLVDRAVEQALVSSPSLTDTIEQNLDNDHGEELQPDEMGYVKGWAREAVFSGIDSGAAHTVDILRQLKVCDQKPTPVQSAYKLGEQQGKALLESTEQVVMPTISKSQCNTDIIANTVMGETKKQVDSFMQANQLCAGYNPSELTVAVDLAQAEANRKLGIEEGMRLAYEALRVRLVQTWQCLPCKCYIRYSGSGPTQCFRTTSSSHPATLINQGEQILPKSECPDTTPVTVGSPLVVDLDGDGVRPDARQRISFDLGATGETVRIPALRGADALLALDVNGNGSIDDGSELFGNATSCGGQRCTDGVEALGRHDQNRDGRIDARDAVFARLRLWRDADGDGKSTTDELVGLSSVGLRAIRLEARLDLSFSTAAGSATRTLIYERTDGVTGQVPDVWFNLTFDRMPSDPRSSGIVSTLR